MPEYIEKGIALATLSKYGITRNMRASKAIAAIHPDDVAPVVRCRDCKHFNMESMECENEAVSTDHEGGASYSLNFYLDDFCSFGERRKTDEVQK